uniref:PAS domain-containing protein n=2 Tax=Mesocestoides corti TaxID=53468 RepID=A0A5K3EXN5_MESCO
MRFRVDQDVAACCNCGGLVRKTRPVDLISNGRFRTMGSRLLFLPGFFEDPHSDAVFFTVLRSVHENISDIMAGMFANIGEHSSASYISDTTFRICRWELRFGGFEEGQSTEEQENEEGGFCLPANLPISYLKSNLVAPRVRVFNDSSVCLSPDGRLLAAFVVPVGDNKCSENEYLEGIVAVYRLQPEDRRGQCVFMQKLHRSSNPVCVDFSPSAEHLVVGLASCRLPSTPSPIDHILRALSNSGPPPCVAHIFKVDRQHNPTEVQRGLTHVKNLPNPRLEDMPDAESIDQHHRSVLLMGLEPNGTGISLNSIVWHPHGITYGTTKGLIVMIRPDPRSLPPQFSELPSTTSTTNHSASMAETESVGPVVEESPLV